MFCHRASQKIIQERQLSGDFTEHGEPFGKNHFNVIIKKVAIRCGFDNAERYTGRSPRVYQINALTNGPVNVPTSEVL